MESPLICSGQHSSSERANLTSALFSTSPEQVGAIGPGLVWDRGQYLLYANGHDEAFQRTAASIWSVA